MTDKTTMWFYYLLATLVVVQSLLSLRGGVRYLAYVRQSLNQQLPVFTPAVTVFAPAVESIRAFAKT
ncbi:MAG: hypothetical protein WKF84_18250 [Pyrinomonadaceae bacterium]